MRSALTAMFIMLIGCDDPSLAINLRVPDSLRGDIASGSLAVVVPTTGAPFSCNDIAFAKVDDLTVQANTVEEVLLLESRSGELQSIPREDYKLLLARGYDAQGEQVLAGCAEFGLIEGDESVTIEGEAVTIATLPVFNLAEVPSRTTEVLITDITGRQVPRVETQWTTTGPGALPASDSSFSDDEGLVLVEIEPPPLPGPVAVDIRAKWARTAPPSLLGFRDPEHLFTDTLPNAGSAGPRDPEELYQVGRIGPNGELGVVAMGSPDATLGQRQVYIAYFDAAIDDFRTVLSDPLPPAAVSVALLTNSGRERMFTTTLSSVIEIQLDGSLDSQPLAAPIGLARRYFPLGDCTDPDAISGLLLSLADGSKVVLNGSGDVVASPFSAADIVGAPLASGCLSSGAQMHRAVIYGGEQTITIVADMDVARRGAISVVPNGIGFTAGSGAEEALLLATQLGIEGTDIVRYRILPTGNDQLDVELVTSDATPTFAQSTSSGDFDGDGLTDVAAVLTFGDSDASDYRLFVSLGIEHATGRVVGLSRPSRAQRPRIWIRDFNSDGHDDILVASAESFEIFSMGAP